MPVQKTNFDPRIPPGLRETLTAYKQLAREALGDRINGAYLIGSIALDDFRPGRSDIDFVTVLNERLLMPGEFGKLRELHRSLARSYAGSKFEGIYVYAWQVGDLDAERKAFPHFHDGKLEWSRRIPMAPVTWWTLKQDGVTLWGPDAQKLPIVLRKDALLAMQRENLHSYWSSWTKRPLRLLKLLTDWGVEWAALGVLRQFYTLRESKITSKTGAGAYALEHLPEQWHALVREAMRLRAGQPRGYGSRFKRARETVGLVRWVIESCAGS